MPFITTQNQFFYGTSPWRFTTSAYCVNNTSAPDYGKCYNITTGKAIFVQTDTTTYPVGSLPCEVDNTCTRYTTTATVLNIATIFNYPGKQGIMQYFWSRSHSPVGFSRSITELILVFIASATGSSTSAEYAWFLPAPNHENAPWPLYDPVTNFKAYFNPYTIPSGNVSILRWYGSYFASTLYLLIYNPGPGNNVWIAGDVYVAWAYESSPLAIIPLDYERDYVPYQELRNAFGYASTGVDQPGWNADDIIQILRELFPNRAWAVFDDRTYTLFLYNLTPNFVPDWLVDRLAPVAMKVLTRPSDSSIAKAWLDELNRRNAYSQPPSELV